MHGFKLFMRLSPHVNVRWPLTSTAYACTLIQLALTMAQPMIFAYLIDDVLIEGDKALVLPLLGLSLGLAVLSILFSFVRSGLFRYLGIRHTLDIRDVLLRHTRAIPLPDIEKPGAGKFTALLGMDAATLGNFLNHVIVEMLSQLFMMVAAFGILFYMDWRLGVVAVACSPFLLLSPRLFRRPLAGYAGQVRTHNEEIGTHLYESIEGSREIRVFGLEGWEQGRNESMYRGLVRASTRETLFRVMSYQTGGLLISAIIAVVYWIGSSQVLDGALSVGMMVASVSYLHNALNPIQQLNNFYGELQSSEVAMARIEQFLATPVDAYARNERAAEEAEAEPAGAEPAGAGVGVEIRDLQVEYDGVRILKDVTLSLPAGKIYAFVGRSGSGKTTLFRTLLGLMPISGGTVVVGGQPLEEMTRKEIVRRFGAVFQESYLFRGTLYENIAIGRLDATEEEVAEAARLADLGALVESLPDGLRTRVDHKGFQLSGGQQQRIAIARALLRRPGILVLDEPTSALDQLTENEVMDAIRSSMAGRTVFVSTHRLRTIENADRIIVMEHGRVVAEGTHAELMRSSRLYFEMASTFETEREPRSGSNEAAEAGVGA